MSFTRIYFIRMNVKFTIICAFQLHVVVVVIFQITFTGNPDI